MSKKVNFSADMQSVKFDNVDIIATSVGTEIHTAISGNPSIGPSGTEIL